MNLLSRKGSEIMKSHYLLTYSVRTLFGNRIKTYKWFKTEEELNDFVDYKMIASGNIIEKLEISDIKEIK